MKTEQRIGDWITTFVGKQFYPLDARPEDICIEDVAHALSHICRYGGHSREFYSVAQHSIYVQEVICDEMGLHHEYDLQLAALIHDATEAYMGDMVRPLKVSMPEYRAAEERLNFICYQALCPVLPARLEWEAVIKEADNMALMAERRDIINHFNREWNIDVPPATRRVKPWSAIQAKVAFLSRYETLAAKAKGDK